MSNRYQLDTNAAIAWLNDSDALDHAFGPDSQFYVSLTTVGELAFGAYRSTRVEHNLQRLEDFLGRVVVLPFDRNTADELGRVANELRRKGRPIPANDMWIAAQARQYGLTLVTRDAHFQHVDGLMTAVW